MPTRFYLPDAGTAPITPTITTGWEQIAGWSAWPTSTTKANTPVASGAARDKNSTVSNNDRLDRVYVSTQQLTAQTIAAGTFSAVIRAVESNAAADAWLQIIIRVVSADGTTQRGTIYAGSTATAESATAGAENQEYGTTSSTRIKNAIATTAVTAQAGDRIQIDIGARLNGTTTSHTFTHRYGDATATADFPLTAGLTSDLCPWVELSQDLSWQPVTVTGTGALDATAFTASGTGTLQVDGAGTLAATAATLTGAGTLGLTGGGAAAATSAELSATGSVTLTGTGDLTAAPTGLTGTGALTLTGTGALAAAPAMLDGSGVVTEPGVVSGAGDLAAPAAELSGAGALTVVGAAELAAQAATLAGAALLTLTGSGGATATMPTLSGAGTVSGPTGAPRDITLTVGEGQSRTLTATGASRTLTVVGEGSRHLEAAPASRSLAAVGRSRTLTVVPEE